MRILALAVGLCACGGSKTGPSVDEVHQQLAPVIEPKLQVIETIVKNELPAPTGTIEVDGPPPEIVVMGEDGKPRGNAIYAFEQDLATPEHYQPNDIRYSDAELVNDCFMMVRKKFRAGGVPGPGRKAMSWKGDEGLAISDMKKCAALRYLMVIRLDTFKPTEYIDKTKFGGGGAIAQIHVYDLDDGKHLGGVAFTALSSSLTSDPSADLRNNFDKAMKTEVRKHLPDAKL